MTCGGCLTSPLLLSAESHLRYADPVMAGLIDRHGPCALHEQPYQPFHTLVASIISQQLSAKAANTIEQRVARIIPSPFQPEDILRVSPDMLRGAGLSSRKATYMRGLAEKVLDGRLSFDALATVEDEVVIETLVESPGIGRWTAEMFLIFGLKRPDVLSLGDAGLRRAANLLYCGTKANSISLERVAESWTPHRSVASWYLWKHVDTLGT